jgi:hypothetical protein
MLGSHSPLTVGSIPKRLQNPVKATEATVKANDEVLANPMC